MIYLELPDLLEIARELLGPDVQIADGGLLGSAVARPQSSAFGVDAYEGLHEKAAALLVSIACNHGLVDGNKRLGWQACVSFCEINGWDVRPPNQDAIVYFVLLVVCGVRDIDLVAPILAKWMVPFNSASVFGWRPLEA